MFPITCPFNPICFAQSPPLFSYIGGPKGEALHLSIESSIWKRGGGVGRVGSSQSQITEPNPCGHQLFYISKIRYIKPPPHAHVFDPTQKKPKDAGILDRGLKKKKERGRVAEGWTDLLQAPRHYFPSEHCDSTLLGKPHVRSIRATQFGAGLHCQAQKGCWTMLDSGGVASRQKQHFWYRRRLCYGGLSNLRSKVKRSQKFRRSS